MEQIRVMTKKDVEDRIARLQYMVDHIVGGCGVTHPSYEAEMERLRETLDKMNELEQS